MADSVYHARLLAKPQMQVLSYSMSMTSITPSCVCSSRTRLRVRLRPCLDPLSALYHDVHRISRREGTILLQIPRRRGVFGLFERRLVLDVSFGVGRRFRLETKGTVFSEELGLEGASATPSSLSTSARRSASSA